MSNTRDWYAYLNDIVDRTNAALQRKAEAGRSRHQAIRSAAFRRPSALGDPVARHRGPPVVETRAAENYRHDQQLPDAVESAAEKQLGDIVRIENELELKDQLQDFRFDVDAQFAKAELQQNKLKSHVEESIGELKYRIEHDIQGSFQQVNDQHRALQKRVDAEGLETKKQARTQQRDLNELQIGVKRCTDGLEDSKARVDSLEAYFSSLRSQIMSDVDRASHRFSDETVKVAQDLRNRLSRLEADNKDWQSRIEEMIRDEIERSVRGAVLQQVQHMNVAAVQAPAAANEELLEQMRGMEAAVATLQQEVRVANDKLMQYREEQHSLAMRQLLTPAAADSAPKGESSDRLPETLQKLERSMNENSLRVRTISNKLKDMEQRLDGGAPGRMEGISTSALSSRSTSPSRSALPAPVRTDSAHSTTPISQSPDRRDSSQLMSQLLTQLARVEQQTSEAVQRFDNDILSVRKLVMPIESKVDKCAEAQRTLEQGLGSARQDVADMESRMRRSLAERVDESASRIREEVKQVKEAAEHSRKISSERLSELEGMTKRSLEDVHDRLSQALSRSKLAEHDAEARRPGAVKLSESRLEAERFADRVHGAILDDPTIKKMGETITTLKRELDDNVLPPLKTCSSRTEMLVTGLNEAQAKLELQTTSLKSEMDRNMETATAELNGHVEKRVTALKRQLDSSAEELKSTIAALDDRVVSDRKIAEAFDRAIQRRVVELEATRAESGGDRESGTEDSPELRQRLAAVEDAVSHLEATRAEPTGDRQGDAEDSSELRQRLTAVEDAVNHLEATRTEPVGDRESGAEDSSELRQRLTAVEDVVHHLDADAWKPAVDNVSGQLEALRSDLENVGEWQSETDSKLHDLDEKLVGSGDRVDKAVSSVEEVSTTLTTLRGTVSTMESQCQQLSEEYDTLPYLAECIQELKQMLQAHVQNCVVDTSNVVPPLPEGKQSPPPQELHADVTGSITEGDDGEAFDFGRDELERSNASELSIATSSRSPFRMDPVISERDGVADSDTQHASRAASKEPSTIVIHSDEDDDTDDDITSSAVVPTTDMGLPVTGAQPMRTEPEDDGGSARASTDNSGSEVDVVELISEDESASPSHSQLHSLPGAGAEHSASAMAALPPEDIIRHAWDENEVGKRISPPIVHHQRRRSLSPLTAAADAFASESSSVPFKDTWAERCTDSESGSPVSPSKSGGSRRALQAEDSLSRLVERMDDSGDIRAKESMDVLGKGDDDPISPHVRVPSDIRTDMSREIILQRPGSTEEMEELMDEIVLESQTRAQTQTVLRETEDNNAAAQVTDSAEAPAPLDERVESESADAEENDEDEDARSGIIDRDEAEEYDSIYKVGPFVADQRSREEKRARMAVDLQPEADEEEYSEADEIPTDSAIEEDIQSAGSWDDDDAYSDGNNAADADTEQPDELEAEAQPGTDRRIAETDDDDEWYAFDKPTASASSEVDVEPAKRSHDEDVSGQDEGEERDSVDISDNELPAKATRGVSAEFDSRVSEYDSPRPVAETTITLAELLKRQDDKGAEEAPPKASDDDKVPSADEMTDPVTWELSGAEDANSAVEEESLVLSSDEEPLHAGSQPKIVWEPPAFPKDEAHADAADSPDRDAASHEEYADDFHLSEELDDSDDLSFGADDPVDLPDATQSPVQMSAANARRLQLLERLADPMVSPDTALKAKKATEASSLETPGSTRSILDASVDSGLDSDDVDSEMNTSQNDRPSQFTYSPGAFRSQ